MKLLEVNFIWHLVWHVVEPETKTQFKDVLLSPSTIYCKLFSIINPVISNFSINAAKILFGSIMIKTLLWKILWQSYFLKKLKLYIFKFCNMTALRNLLSDQRRFAMLCITMIFLLWYVSRVFFMFICFQTK